MPRIPEDIKWEATRNTLGSGGQSQIYEVTLKEGASVQKKGQELLAPTSPPTCYALKALSNHSSQQAIGRFRREIDAIQRLDHPGIVEIIDFSQGNQDFLYYVMPSYKDDYRSLGKIAFQPESPFRMQPKQCLEFIANCADALGAAHKNGVIHRDIKPDNILVHNHSRKPLIIDFGCCQVLDHEAITLVDEGVGTQYYMAPECESGSEGEVSAKSDIYSLGKLLWSIITGEKAFGRERPAFTGRNLSKMFPDAPDCWHLTTIFERSIRQNPADRFKSAEEMAKECRRLARQIVGRYLPLELIQKVCPVCGNAFSEKHGSALPEDQRVSLHMVFGDPMPKGTRAIQCLHCGFLSAWDTRPIKAREGRLESMD